MKVLTFPSSISLNVNVTVQLVLFLCMKLCQLLLIIFNCIHHHNIKSSFIFITTHSGYYFL